MKTIFMDIDGTLCGVDGSVPESAANAIRLARNKGHKVFLCTGRSKPEIVDDIINIGFDGVIGAGGAFIEVDGEVLLHETMNGTDVHLVEDYFKEHDVGYYLESNDGLFASDNCVSAIQEVTGDLDESHTNWFYDILNESRKREINYDNINKISFISKDYPYDDVHEKFEDVFEMHHSTVSMFGHNSGELAVKGHTKLTAINRVLDHLDIAFEDTFAFGDGDNDRDMFRAVSYRVAMKNGTDGLKAMAHEISDIAEEDGIESSFKRLGL